MILIDLYSQREAVENYLATSGGDAIAWLQTQGELIEIPIAEPFPKAYRFRSRVGIEIGFVVRDGQMIFIGDHTTIGSIAIR